MNLTKEVRERKLWWCEHQESAHKEKPEDNFVTIGVED